MDGWVDVTEIRVNIDVFVVRVCMLCVPLCCVFLSMLSVYLVCCVYLVCVWYDVWVHVCGLCVYASVCLSMVCVCVCAHSCVPVQMTADLAFP